MRAYAYLDIGFVGGRAGLRAEATIGWQIKADTLEGLDGGYADPNLKLTVAFFYGYKYGKWFGSEWVDNDLFSHSAEMPISLR